MANGGSHDRRDRRTGPARRRNPPPTWMTKESSSNAIVSASRTRAHRGTEDSEPDERLESALNRYSSSTMAARACSSEEKANGKNKSKTFSPLCSVKLTFFLSLSNKVKSGAICPICKGIFKNMQQVSSNKVVNILEPWTANIIQT